MTLKYYHDENNRFLQRMSTRSICEANICTFDKMRERRCPLRNFSTNARFEIGLSVKFPNKLTRKVPPTDYRRCNAFMTALFSCKYVRKRKHRFSRKAFTFRTVRPFLAVMQGILQ